MSPFLNAKLNNKPCSQMEIVERLFNHPDSKKLGCTSKIAQTIFSHGFYGGEESPDRIAPEKIIDFFSKRFLEEFDSESSDQNSGFSQSPIRGSNVTKTELKLADFDFGKPVKDKGTDFVLNAKNKTCLLYTSPSPRDQRGSRMPSSA